MSSPPTEEEMLAWYVKNDPIQVPKSTHLRAMMRTSWKRSIGNVALDDDDILCLKSAHDIACHSKNMNNKNCLKRFPDGSLVDFTYLDDIITLGEPVCRHPTFDEVLAFAEDLSLAYSAGVKMGQSNIIAAHPLPNPSMSAKQTIIEDLTTHNKSKEDDVDVVEKKKNPFSSAKDRFQQEGGKLPAAKNINGKSQSSSNQTKTGENEDLPPELANCDKALVEKIEADIIHHGHRVTFADIAGLDFAKECVIETICWPITQPQLFQGLRSLPRGVLLFGPPGTGKTLIGKAIAHQSGATFFSISASSLMSKWIGEGEKTVRTLFAVAAYRQPSVVFIDEVDSLLCQRSADENEASRRIKTEFMVQLDGANTNLDARVVIIGATNRPEELDEAVRRRFVKRLYIPLPDDVSRRELIKKLIKDVYHDLTIDHVEELTMKTDGYSGADIRNLCTEAAMGPIRQLAQRSRGNLTNITTEDVPPITFSHFETALETVTPSVSPEDLKRYLDWNSLYGSFKRQR